MRLPTFQDTRIHYRRKLWGKSQNVAYYNSERQQWYCKMNRTTKDPGAPLSHDNKMVDDWTKLGTMIGGFKKGDLISISYISTHDAHHHRRHDFIGKKFYVQEIIQVKHPEMTSYKGESPWFECVLYTTDGHNTRSSFRYIQIKMHDPYPETDEPVQEQTAIAIATVTYGDISAINKRILQIQADKNGSFRTPEEGAIAYDKYVKKNKLNRKLNYEQ